MKGMPSLKFFISKSNGADRRFKSEKLQEVSKKYLQRPWNV